MFATKKSESVAKTPIKTPKVFYLIIIIAYGERKNMNISLILLKYSDFWQNM